MRLVSRTTCSDGMRNRKWNVTAGRQLSQEFRLTAVRDLGAPKNMQAQCLHGHSAAWLCHPVCRPQDSDMTVRGNVEGDQEALIDVHRTGSGPCNGRRSL